MNVAVVDLNEIGEGCVSVLSSHAAMHKRAVRPRGRRASSAYQPYLASRRTTDQVCIAWVCITLLLIQ